MVITTDSPLVVHHHVGDHLAVAVEMAPERFVFVRAYRMPRVSLIVGGEIDVLHQLEIHVFAARRNLDVGIVGVHVIEDPVCRVVVERCAGPDEIPELFQFRVILDFNGAVLRDLDHHIDPFIDGVGGGVEGFHVHLADLVDGELQVVGGGQHGGAALGSPLYPVGADAGDRSAGDVPGHLRVRRQADGRCRGGGGLRGERDIVEGLHLGVHVGLVLPLFTQAQASSDHLTGRLSFRPAIHIRAADSRRIAELLVIVVVDDLLDFRRAAVQCAGDVVAVDIADVVVVGRRIGVGALHAGDAAHVEAAIDLARVVAALLALAGLARQSADVVGAAHAARVERPADGTDRVLADQAARVVAVFRILFVPAGLLAGLDVAGVVGILHGDADACRLADQAADTGVSGDVCRVAAAVHVAGQLSADAADELPARHGDVVGAQVDLHIAFGQCADDSAHILGVIGLDEAGASGATALYHEVVGVVDELSVAHDAADMAAGGRDGDLGVQEGAVLHGAQRVVPADTAAAVMVESEVGAIDPAACDAVLPHRAADAAVAHPFRAADGQARHLAVLHGAFFAVPDHAAHARHRAAVRAADGAAGGCAAAHVARVVAAADAAPGGAAAAMGDCGVVAPAPRDDAPVIVAAHDTLDTAAAAQPGVGEIEAVDTAAVGDTPAQIAEKAHRVVVGGESHAGDRMPPAVEEPLEGVRRRADGGPRRRAVQIHHLARQLEEEPFALVGDGEDVGNPLRTGMVGPGLKVIVEGVARVDEVAEMHQFQGVLDDQRVFRGVADVEFHDFVVLAAMGRLHVDHPHALDFHRAGCVVELHIVAVLLAPGHAVRAAADLEFLHRHRLGQFKRARLVLRQL